jgi:hypothetical protein
MHGLPRPQRYAGGEPAIVNGMLTPASTHTCAREFSIAIVIAI